MIEIEGMISVAEAAKRLNRSIEQVRRNLRDGKLKGQRIGNQWFVDSKSLSNKQVSTTKPDPFEEARVFREKLRARYGNFDINALIAESREGR
jgi:excisionase family DNA binding protein